MSLYLTIAHKLLVWYAVFQSIERRTVRPSVAISQWAVFANNRRAGDKCHACDRRTWCCIRGTPCIRSTNYNLQ